MNPHAKAIIKELLLPNGSCKPLARVNVALVTAKLLCWIGESSPHEVAMPRLTICGFKKMVKTYGTAERVSGDDACYLYTAWRALCRAIPATTMQFTLPPACLPTETRAGWHASREGTTTKETS